MRPEERQAAIDTVLLEGLLLDQKKWDDWLQLYTEDAEYWVPAWEDEDELCEDPQTAISLIYYDSRDGLEGRIYRLRTEKSLISHPLPRTCHLTTNLLATQDSEDADVIVTSSWTVHSCRLDKTSFLFGNQTHHLRRDGSGFRIRKRKIIVCNDRIATVLDVYSV